MTLRLTPKVLIRAYEYIRVTEPFDRLKLPSHKAIKFRVTRHKDRFAHTLGYRRTKEVEIAVSEKCVGSSRVLIECMSHECIHLYQHLNGTETANTQHNAEFEALADEACKCHGFDRKTF